MKLVRKFTEEERTFFEMAANLRPADTGLPMVIWVSTRSGVPHGPRIKVAKNYGDRISGNNTFTITLEPTPRTIGNIGEIKRRDIDSVLAFVKENHAALMRHWDEEISTMELFKLLVKA